MAFNFEKLKLSQKRFLARSFDKMLIARSRNAVIERHLEIRQNRLQCLENRRQRLEKRDRLLLIKHWRISSERKSPEPGEWLNRQKSQIWREQARDRIKKRGSRPGPIIPAMIFANDGSSHQISLQNGDFRQKAMRTKDKDKEREEFLNILPKVSFLAKYSKSPRSLSAKDRLLQEVNNSENPRSLSAKPRTLPDATNWEYSGDLPATDKILPDITNSTKSRTVLAKDRSITSVSNLDALRICNNLMSALSRPHTAVTKSDSKIAIATTTTAIPTESRLQDSHKVTFDDQILES